MKTRGIYGMIFNEKVLILLKIYGNREMDGRTGNRSNEDLAFARLRGSTEIHGKEGNRIMV